MDYKALIERIRRESQSFDAYHCEGLHHALEDAVLAIETLLAERDALMAEIRGHCDSCVNRRYCIFDEDKRRDCALNKSRNWQWRGPADHKEEDTADD